MRAAVPVLEPPPAPSAPREPPVPPAAGAGPAEAADAEAPPLIPVTLADTAALPPPLALSRHQSMPYKAPERDEGKASSPLRTRRSMLRLRAPSSTASLAERLARLLPNGAAALEKPLPSFTAEAVDGPLGLTMETDFYHRLAVVKEYVPTGSLLSPSPIVPGMALVRVAGRSVVGMGFEAVMQLLRHTPRPMTLRFALPTEPEARAAQEICRVCELPVPAQCLRAHSHHCVLYKQADRNAGMLAFHLAELQRELRDALPHLRAVHPVELSVLQTLIDCSRQELRSARPDRVADVVRFVETAPRVAELCRAFESNEHIGHLVRDFDDLVKSLAAVLPSGLAAWHRSWAARFTMAAERRVSARRSVSLPAVLSAALGENVTKLVAPAPEAPPSVQDFEILKQISSGGFGYIFLVKKRRTGDLFAMKVVRKDHHERLKQKHRLLTERSILARAQHPFIVKLFFTFQTRNYVYLVMEWVPGGDMRTLLENVLVLDEPVARKYVAEALVATRYVHAQGCIHRDIKPGNFLIGSDGHLRLIDFGLSEAGLAERRLRQVSSIDEMDVAALDAPPPPPSPPVDVPQARRRSSMLAALRTGSGSPGPDDYDSETDDGEAADEAARLQLALERQDFAMLEAGGAAGSPDYLAPEVIRGDPHGPSVDLWAIGVMLFEMLVGYPPFNDRSPEAICDNILQLDYEWPPADELQVSPEARDLVARLLVDDPGMRLTMDEVMAHAFFDGVDWEGVYSQEVPFKPRLRDAADVRYFKTAHDHHAQTASAVVPSPRAGGGGGDAGASLGSAAGGDEDVVSISLDDVETELFAPLTDSPGGSTGSPGSAVAAGCCSDEASVDADDADARCERVATSFDFQHFENLGRKNAELASKLSPQLRTRELRSPSLTASSDGTEEPAAVEQRRGSTEGPHDVFKAGRGRWHRRSSV